MKIEAKDVSVVIDGRPILQDVTLVCAPGEITGLVGPSGSGKTTLLNCVGLLQPPTHGKVLIDGTDTTAWRASRRRKFWIEHAAFILQDYGTVEDESVAFNVTMTATLLRRRTLGDIDRLNAALEEVGLADRNTELASHLSGGEKQRLSMARTTYKRADAIFVDEPTASLDSTNRATIVGLLRLRAQQGATVVVATHDEEMIAACDTLLHLHDHTRKAGTVT